MKDWNKQYDRTVKAASRPNGDFHFFWRQAMTFYDAASMHMPAPSPNRSVLDFGCGVGRFVPHLMSRFGDYVGYDPSYKAITLAREHWRWLENALFMNAMPADQYDLVWCCTVLHHISDNDEAFWDVDEMGKRARPGGMIVLIERTGPGYATKTIKLRSANTYTRWLKHWCDSVEHFYVTPEGGNEHTVFIGLKP